MSLGTDVLLKLVIAAQDQTGAAFKSAKDGIESVQTASEKMWAATKAYLTFDIAIEGVNKLKEGLMAILETGGQFEKFGASLTTLMGGESQGKAAFDWIKQFAKDTPYEVDQVTQAFVKMKAYGLDPMDGSLKAIAEQTAKTAGTQEDLQLIVMALGQAWTRQSLHAQDANQLIERGVPVWAILSEVMGKSTAEIMKMSEAGKIGRDEIRLLIEQMGKSSEGALETQMHTWNGLVSNLKDNWTQFLDTIANSGVLDYFKSKVQEANDAFGRMGQSGELEAKARQIADAFVSMGKAVAGGAEFLANHFDILSKLGEGLAVLYGSTLVKSVLAYAQSLVQGTQAQSANTAAMAENKAAQVQSMQADSEQAALKVSLTQKILAQSRAQAQLAGTLETAKLANVQMAQFELANAEAIQRETLALEQNIVAARARVANSTTIQGTIAAENQLTAALEAQAQAGWTVVAADKAVIAAKTQLAAAQTEATAATTESSLAMKELSAAEKTGAIASKELAASQTAMGAATEATAVSTTLAQKAMMGWTALVGALPALVGTIMSLQFAWEENSKAIDEYKQRQKLVQDALKDSADAHIDLKHKINETLAADQAFADTALLSGASFKALTKAQGDEYLSTLAKARDYWNAIASNDKLMGDLAGMGKAEAKADAYTKTLAELTANVVGVKDAQVANDNQLKLSTQQLDQNYKQQNADIASALKTRLALIDATDASAKDRAQLKQQAETDSLQLRLDAAKLFELQRLKVVNDAFTTELDSTKANEDKHTKAVADSIEARKATYASLATAYEQVANAMATQYSKDVQAYNATTQSIKNLSLTHEQDLYNAKLMGMDDRQKLDAEESRRDSVIQQLKAEAAKGAKADQDTINRLYREALMLTGQVEQAQIQKNNTMVGKDMAASEAAGKLNEAYGAQKSALEALAQQQKSNADQLLPSLTEANGKVADMNAQLAAMDKSLAESKQLDLQLVGAADVRATLNSLLQTETKTIIVQTVQQTVAAAPADSGPSSAPQGNRLGGLIQALARGGQLPGYGGGDSVPALLEPGEFVVRKEAVQKYGPSLFEGLNTQKYGWGGAVSMGSSANYGKPSSQPAKAAAAPATSGGTAANNDIANYSALFDTLLNSKTDALTSFIGLSGIDMQWEAGAGYNEAIASVRGQLDRFIEASPTGVQAALKQKVVDFLQILVGEQMLTTISKYAMSRLPIPQTVAIQLSSNNPHNLTQGLIDHYGGTNIDDQLLEILRSVTSNGQAMPKGDQAWFSTAQAAVKTVLGHQDGGLIHALAGGGQLPGYGGGDTVPAMLEPGEFVIRKEAVKTYGPSLFEGLNALSAQVNGQLASMRTPPGGGAQSPPLQPIQIISASGKSATVMGSPTDHQQLVDILKYHALTTNH